MEILQIIIGGTISGLFSILVVAIPIIHKDRKEKKKSNDVINESLKCLLRSQMLSIYEQCKKDKKITRYQLQNFIYMYEQYKILNGNSFIDEIYEIIKTYVIID